MVTMDDREIRLADITVPLLAFGGASDGIAPVGCVRPIVDLVPGVAKMRFEVVPGGHLGMLTGRAARGTTWRILDEWIAENSSADVAEPTPQAARKTASATKTAAGRKTAAKKPAAGRQPRRRQPPRRPRQRSSRRPGGAPPARPRSGPTRPGATAPRAPAA